jgi:hypothetical protein
MLRFTVSLGCLKARQTNSPKDVIDTIVRTIRLEYSKDNMTRTKIELHMVKPESCLSPKIKIMYVEEKIMAFICAMRNGLLVTLLKKYGSTENNAIKMLIPTTLPDI